MVVEGAALLAKLAGGIISGIGSAAPQKPIEGKSFAELMGEARVGQYSSGRPVLVSPDSGVELTARQLDRLESVVDAAEASGASRIGAVIDGQMLRIDVLTRTVESTADSGAGEILMDVDSVVVVPSEGEDEGEDEIENGGGADVAGAVSLAGLGGQVSNRSVAELIGSLGGPQGN